MPDSEVLWAVIGATSLAALGWASDRGWRILRASLSTRFISGTLFALAIGGALAGLFGVQGYPLAMLALGPFVWTSFLGKRVGPSGRRYRTMVGYKRLLWLWHDRETTDPRAAALAILDDLQRCRDPRTAALIDAMLVAWPMILNRPLDGSWAPEMESTNRATQRMNDEAARLFGPDSHP
jgi:hypothetical protein